VDPVELVPDERTELSAFTVLVLDEGEALVLVYLVDGALTISNTNFNRY
jgi:hypothetical protein